MTNKLIKFNNSEYTLFYATEYNFSFNALFDNRIRKLCVANEKTSKIL